MDIMKAVEHIYQGNAAYILTHNNEPSNVGGVDEDKEIVDIKNFNKVERAGLDGCKSFVLSLYQLHFLDESISLARKAIEGNPSNALWHFVLGKCLRKKRRNFMSHRSESSDFERHCFNTAAKRCPHVFYQIHYVQAQHEAIFTSKASIINRQFFMEQWMRYEEISRICGDIPVILLKVALGMLRCGKARDTNVIHSILDRLDELLKDKDVLYHYRGMAYKYNGQYEKALEYLKRSADLGNPVADYQYLQCMVDTKKPYADIIMVLVKTKRKYKDSESNIQLPILLNLAIMFYIISNYKDSAKVFLQAIEMSPNNHKLMTAHNFATATMKSTYHFVRSALLPKMRRDASNRTDCEFTNALQQLVRHCDSHFRSRERIGRNQSIVT